jgi:hypothetical protein
VNAKVTFSVAVAVLALFTPAFGATWAMRASVPFEFTLSQQTLAAGDYCVSMNGPVVLRVARINGPDSAEVTTDSVRSVNLVPPAMVFHRYGSRYFLAEVWIGESSSGRQLFATAAELEIARTMKQESTTVLARPLPLKSC